MFRGNKIHVRVLEPANGVSVTSSSMSVNVPEVSSFTGTDFQSIDLTSSSMPIAISKAPLGVQTQMDRESLYWDQTALITKNYY